MPDETKPILSSETKPDKIIGTEPVENKRDVSGDQTVSVKALRTFHKDGDMKGDVVTPDSPPFTVDRQRAAQLRANGLIEYTNDGDAHAIHGEAGAKILDDRAARQAEASKIPANSKGTPLRNPEVKLADVKDGK
jgi:hypothetical protein